MKPFITGVILGMVILLPGMSGGTLLLIFGLHETLLKDISRLKLAKYKRLAAGTVIGIVLSGWIFTYLFTAYRDPAMALLLGCLLGSIKAIFTRVPKCNPKWLLYLFLGVLIGLVSVSEPMGTGILADIGYIKLFVGGALSSAAMIIPGLPGSTVLILMNMYEEIIYYVSVLNIPKLFFFGFGSLIGMALLVKLLNRFYESYRVELSYLFAGIIIGSSRALLPFDWGAIVIMMFAIGFTVTFAFSDKLDA